MAAITSAASVVSHTSQHHTSPTMPEKVTPKTSTNNAPRPSNSKQATPGTSSSATKSQTAAAKAKPSSTTVPKPQKPRSKKSKPEPIKKQDNQTLLKDFLQAQNRCPICWTRELVDPVITPCKHVYCRGCIVNNLDTDRLCPYCRQPLMDKLNGTLVKGGLVALEVQEQAEEEVVAGGDEVAKSEVANKDVKRKMERIRRLGDKLKKGARKLLKAVRL